MVNALSSKVAVFANFVAEKFHNYDWERVN